MSDDQADIADIPILSNKSPPAANSREHVNPGDVVLFSRMHLHLFVNGFPFFLGGFVSQTNKTLHAATRWSSTLTARKTLSVIIR